MADRSPPARAAAPERITCALCGANAPLLASHIVPKFVYRFMRRTSPGLIRDTQSPNELHQDGPTLPLLCEECEGLFSTWETPFAREVFLPLHENRVEGVPSFRYGPWALKFATSISWRTVQFHRAHAQDGRPRHLSAEQQALLDRAEETWVSFMRGTAANPGIFEQHIYPLDTLESGPASLPVGINPYLLRSVDMDVVAAPGTVFVYTKMLRLMVIGFVQIADERDWHGGKLHVRKGLLGTRTYRMPGRMLEYFSRRVEAVAVAQRSLSPRQRARTRRLIDRNLDRLVGTEIFRATDADVHLFGDAVFSNRDDQRK
jgi:hypothetical protein